MRRINDWQSKAGLAFLAVLSVFLLAGCGEAQPPYVVLFESYFPSWLVSAAVGCIAALVVRVVLVRWGVHEYLPFPLLTYIAIAAIVMFLISLFIFSR